MTTRSSLLITSVALAACARARGPGEIGRLDRQVVEASGMVASARDTDLFWVHGDSGTEPVLFAITAKGRIVSRARVTAPPNLPATSDWEDIARDAHGRLWIADSGNNANRRRDLAVFAVDEPPRGHDGPVSVQQVVRFRYPDQTAFPDPDRMDFDAEGLFWSGDALYLLSKHRSDTRTTLYRFPAHSGDVVLERISDRDVGGDPARFGGRVTAADLSPDGQTLAVLTYHAVLLFPRPAVGDDWLAADPKVIPLDQDRLRQCEGVAWSRAALLIHNEDGVVFRIDDPLQHRGTFPSSH